MIWHVPKPDFTRSSSTTSVDTDDQVNIFWTTLQQNLHDLRLCLHLLVTALIAQCFECRRVHSSVTSYQSCIKIAPVNALARGFAKMGKMAYSCALLSMNFIRNWESRVIDKSCKKFFHSGP